MDNAILKIYGDIGEPDKMMEVFGISDESTTSVKMVSQFLEEHKDSTSITVKINSRGGDVQEGWGIYDLLTNSGKKIKTIGESKVYSIATIVFLAGTEREMFANADGLIHNPYIPPYTLADAYEADDLTKLAEGLAQEEEKILNFYAERTGADKAKLAEYMAADTKLSAEDMLSLGFATKIIESVMAFAYIKSKNKFKMDEKDVKTFGEKLDAIIAKISGFSRLPSKDQTLTDKDGKEVKLEKETGAPAVGDKASPDGTYVMASGQKITVSGGVITEMTNEKSELDLAKEKIAELKAKVALAETEKIAATAAIKEAEAEKTKAVAITAELTALRNTWKPAARGQLLRTEKDTGGVDKARVKELYALNNKKQ
jgi:ATP-dependent Clp protease protease subunit